MNKIVKGIVIGAISSTLIGGISGLYEIQHAKFEREFSTLPEEYQKALIATNFEPYSMGEILTNKKPNSPLSIHINTK